MLALVLMLAGMVAAAWFVIEQGHGRRPFHALLACWLTFAFVILAVGAELVPRLAMPAAVIAAQLPATH